MAIDHSHSVRLPPDSTGKRVRVIKFLEVPYTGMTEALEPGDHVRFTRLGATITHGFVRRVADSGGSGIFAFVVHHDHQSPSDGVTTGDLVERAETGGYVQRAVVSGPSLEFYFNANALVSSDNPFFGQRIDQYGAAFIRFAEGAVTFDGTGRLRQVNNLSIMANEFHDIMADEFTTIPTGGGTVTHNNIQQCVVLGTDGIAGSKAQLISNKYLYHEANAATFADTSVRIGDAGKANVTRRWGVFTFEKDEGIFFEQVGTAMYLVLRNKSSGVPVDTIVPQASWNHDGLGVGTTNPSLFKLDTTKVNSYWIEWVQDGAGVAKAGIFNEENVRILCHTFQGNNVFTTGFLSQGSFPFHYEVEDNGGGSTSEMFVYSCSCEIEGPRAAVSGKFYEGCSDPLPVSDMNNWVPLFSLRPKVLLADGIRKNHNVWLPKLISIDVVDDTDKVTPRRVKIEVFRHKEAQGLLTGAVWAKTKGNAQTDYKATLSNNLGATGFTSTGSTAVAEWIVRGNKDLDLKDIFNYMDKYVANDADGDQIVITIAAKTLEPGITANIVTALTWEEVESR